MQFKQNQHRISTNQFKTNQKWELRRWSWDFTTSFCFSSGIIFEKVIFKQYLSSCPLFFSWFPPRFSIGTFLDSIVCGFFFWFFFFNTISFKFAFPHFFFFFLENNNADWKTFLRYDQATVCLLKWWTRHWLQSSNDEVLSWPLFPRGCNWDQKE